MSTIKVGFVGTGYISHFHARGLKEIEGVELKCIIDPNKESGEKFGVLFCME